MPPPPSTPPTLRVASVPAAHPYVEHLSDPVADDGIVRLPDPTPDVTDPLPGQWWPPPVLEPAWIRSQHRTFDLVHLHFGFDAASPDRLRQWVAELRAAGTPLVFTVHDLVNPHFADAADHLAQLDVLVPAADALITLTPGAATEIADRWGRTATVVPHPHVVPLDRSATSAGPSTTYVIGVSAKNLRANIDPLPVLAALVPLLTELPDVILRVDVHREVISPGRIDDRARAFRGWVAAHAGHSRIEVVPHDRYTDDELFDHLAALDLSVLPYRFGTHSGWLEACVDLDTAAVVPDVGHYRDQHGHPAFRFPGTGTGTGGSVGGGVELADLVRAVHAGTANARPARPDRRRQRAAIAATHRDLYRSVVRGPPG